MKVRVGLFGGGIVGGGVVELVNRCLQSGRLSEVGASIEIVKICVRSKDKPRDFEFNPLTTSLVTKYEDILDDSSINCVVELMGGILTCLLTICFKRILTYRITSYYIGVTSAKDVVFRAIAAGKHVVTANKALIAAYLPELQTALKANPKVSFNYEAAVCGGNDAYYRFFVVSLHSFNVVLIYSFVFRRSLEDKNIHSWVVVISEHIFSLRNSHHTYIAD